MRLPNFVTLTLISVGRNKKKKKPTECNFTQLTEAGSVTFPTQPIGSSMCRRRLTPVEDNSIQTSLLKQEHKHSRNPSQCIHRVDIDMHGCMQLHILDTPHPPKHNLHISPLSSWPLCEFPSVKGIYHQPYGMHGVKDYSQFAQSWPNCTGWLSYLGDGGGLLFACTNDKVSLLICFLLDSKNMRRALRTGRRGKGKEIKATDSTTAVRRDTCKDM